MTADKLEAPSSGYGLINLAASWTANQPHTFSIFAKSAEWNRIGIRIYDGTSYFIRTNINLDTGETVSGNNGAGTLKVDKFANGWWRISVSGTPVSTYSYSSRISVEPHNTAIVQNNDPSSSKEGIYIWGWQWEQKAFPTSYIATNGAEVTRGMENVTITDDEFTDFYNPLESTAVCEFDTSNWITYNNISYERIWRFSNGSESDVFEAFKQHVSTHQVRYRVRDGGANVLGAANISYGTNTTPKVAFALKLNDAAVTVNGGTPGGTTDTSVPMPTVDRLVLGNYGVGANTTNRLFGHLRSFTYYPVKLPDSQIVTPISYTHLTLPTKRIV